MFNMHSPLARHKNVELRLLDGQAVLLSLDDGLLFELNDVGTAIWQMIDGTKCGNELAKMLTEQFEIELKQAAEDVRDFLSKLWADEMIEYVG